MPNKKNANSKQKKGERLVEKLEKIARVNKTTGESRWVKIETLVAHDPRFATGNGGGWCRDDGQVGKKYKIEKQRGAHNRILKVRLAGYNTNPKPVKDKEGIVYLEGKKYRVTFD